MPIKGLTDVRMMPRIGIIRIGERNEKGYTRALDHFVGPPEFHEQYGPAPKELTIIFPTDNMRPDGDPEILRTRLQRYTATTLMCYGDGQAAHQRQKDRSWLDIACPCPLLKSPDNPKGPCTRNAYLMFQLPDIRNSKIGVWQLSTTSFNSIRRLINQLDQLTNDYGTFAGYPLQLSVSIEEVRRLVPDDRNPKDMRPIPAYVPLLSLRLIGTLADTRKAAAQYIAERHTLGRMIHVEDPDFAQRPDLLNPEIDDIEDAAAVAAAEIRAAYDGTVNAETDDAPAPAPPDDWVPPQEDEAPPAPKAAPAPPAITPDQDEKMRKLWARLGVPRSRAQAELQSWPGSIEEYIKHLEAIVTAADAKRSARRQGAAR